MKEEQSVRSVEGMWFVQMEACESGCQSAGTHYGSASL